MHVETQTSLRDDFIHTDVISNYNGIIGAGDTELHLNFLSDVEATEYFKLLQSEIEYQQWYHMPDNKDRLLPLKRIKRALAVPDSNGNIPYYRFTVNDQSHYGIMTPMTPTVEIIRKKILNFFGYDLNHAVVLLYRDGSDCIGYHKDKTLDLDETSPIISVSLGRERTYSLTDDIRNPTKTQEFKLPNGSLLCLGPKTNSNFYHAIKPCEDTKNENGIRISLTFRKADTYKTPSGELVGKGAVYQSHNWPVELKGRHVSSKLQI